MAKCFWCEKTYECSDSTAPSEARYFCCSASCQQEYLCAKKESERWAEEIRDAWDEYRKVNEPDDDEHLPDVELIYTCTKREYLKLRSRYLSWKSNHCWKTSFWTDSSEHVDDNEGVSFGSDSGGGVGKTVLNLVIMVVVVWLGWKVVRFGWSLLFGGSREVDPQVEMTESWQRHLEQRREAFSDGLSEKEVEAKGLVNYTWEEWQSRQSEKRPTPVDTGNVESKVNKVKEIAQNVASAGVEEVGNKAKALWQSITSKEAENAEPKDDKNTEDELKRLNARIAELEDARKAGEQQSAAMPEVEEQKPTAPKVEDPKTAISPPESTKVNALVDTGFDTNSDDGQNDTRRRASKDSKRIGVIVLGKGKTKDAAVRYAIRQAVWKTVGTWVGSKARIDENHEQVVALVETVTEADIAKFEVADIQQKDETFVVKVRASVSKKQIAPKFAKVFPDVFGNE